MTVTITDQIMVALQRTPFCYGKIVPQDAASVTVQMQASSSMPALLAGNVLGINQTVPYPIKQIASDKFGQTFLIGTPVSS